MRFILIEHIDLLSKNEETNLRQCLVNLNLEFKIGKLEDGD